MKRFAIVVFALVFVCACGKTADVVDFDASGNPVGDGGADVLTKDATPGVTRNGWTWNNVGPQAADLYGVWGTSSSDVWFVGAAGTILHFDGATFTAPTSPSSEELRGVWASSANDVWAVSRPYWDTSDAEILHYDGNAWSIATTFPKTELYAVGGRTGNDVWAVGTKGFTAHFDGAKWTQVASSTQNDLNGVWVSPTGSAWAVGAAAPFPSSSTIIRFTGSSWVTMPSPDSQRGDYEHVWGSSDGDVWLAGQAQIDKTQPGLDPNGYAIHWNGVGWDAPLIVSDFSTPLHAVFGSSASHVCAVGAASAAQTWNGSSWTQSALPGNFESVWESSPSDTWAVGIGGVMAHFDGSAWTELTPPPPDYGVYSATSIWSNGPSDAWIAGNGALDAELLHWDGHAWNPSSIASTSSAWIYFFALWGTSASNMWAVGAGPDPQTGRIIHFDGSTWSVMWDQDKIYEFLGVWGSSANDVWFSGGDGAMVHWDGSKMSAQSLPEPTQDQLFALGGTSSTDVWLSGSTNEDLTIRHWNGSSWSTAFTGNGFITSFYVPSTSEVWGVGWEGSVVHFDGSTWTQPTLPREVGSIWGSSPQDIWGVGYFGSVVHYDGAAWSFVPLTESTLAGVSGSSALDVWMVTAAGAILHHP